LTVKITLVGRERIQSSVVRPLRQALSYAAGTIGLTTRAPQPPEQASPVRNAKLTASDARAQRRHLAETAEPDKAAVLEVLKKILQAKELPKTPTATRVQERLKRRLSPGLQKAFRVEEKLTRSTLLDEVAMELLMAFTTPYFKDVLIRKGKLAAEAPPAEVEVKVRSWIAGQWRKAGLMEFMQKLPGVAVSNGALAGAKTLGSVELFLIRELVATLLTFEANLFTRITGVVINEAGRPRLPPDLAAAATFDDIGDQYRTVAADLLQASLELHQTLQGCTGSSLTPQQTQDLRQRRAALAQRLQAFADAEKQHAISRRVYERLDKPTASALGAIVNIAIPATVMLSGQSGLALKLLPVLLATQAAANTMDFTRTQRNTLRFIAEHHDFSSLIKPESRDKPWNELEVGDLVDDEVKRFNPVTFQPIEIKKLIDEVCSAAWNDLDARKRKLIEKHAAPYLQALQAARVQKEQQRDLARDSAKPATPTEDIDIDRIEVEGEGDTAAVDEAIRQLQGAIELCERRQWMTLLDSPLDVELPTFQPSVKAGKAVEPDDAQSPNPLARALRQDPKFCKLETRLKHLEAAIALHAEGTPDAYRELLTNEATSSTPVAKAWGGTSRLVLNTERARRRHKIGEIPALFLKTIGSRYHPAGQGLETALIAICNHVGGRDFMLDGLHSLQGTGPSNRDAEGMFVGTMAHIVFVSVAAVYGRRDFNYTQDYILRLKMGVPDLFTQGGSFMKNVEAVLSESGGPTPDDAFLKDARKLLQDGRAKGLLSRQQHEVLEQAFVLLHGRRQGDADAAVSTEQEQQLMETLRGFATHWGEGADREWADRKIESESGATVKIGVKGSGTRYTNEVSLKQRMTRVPKSVQTGLLSVPAQHMRMSQANKAHKLAEKEADKANRLIRQTDRLLAPIDLPVVPSVSALELLSQEKATLDDFYKGVIGTA
jgi:hypothetical protein